MKRNSLAVAIEALSWIAYARLGERTALFRAAKQLNATPDELRQAHRLVMETTRYQNRLEYYVSLVSDFRLDLIPHGVSAFLKILAFLKHVDREDEEQLRRTVSFAREILGWRSLRQYEEVIGQIISQTCSTLNYGEDERISIETCHPDWYVQRVLFVFGRNVGLQILNRNLESLPLYIRENWLRSNSSPALDTTGAMRVEGLSGVWKLAKSRRLDRQELELVKTGGIVIQDLSTIISVLVASPQPGDRIVDVCAAPGIKSSHLAALMYNEGEILSIDISGDRMKHWRKEIDRVGSRISNGIVADATVLELNVQAQVVIVDPPCSNTGVFAKNPTLKWRLSPARVQALIAKQSSILESASKYVISGGRLIYSTCSILPEENEDVISSFLSTNPDFTVERQNPFLGSPGLKGLERCQRFYPNLHDCNGYFIAKLRRN